jgi:tetratricopeptide (TPR) repeat protein
LTDNLINQLYKVAGLKITARTSVMHYKGTTKQMRIIGEELGVRHLLEASVQRSQDRVIITAQLIDAESETNLWAEKYDRRIEDIFDIQNAVALAIAQALQATLTPEIEARMAVRPTENLAAYRAYQEGLRLSSSGYSRKNIANSIDAFESAVQLDPQFAEAWSQLAVKHLFNRWSGFVEPDGALADAEWALERATALAPEHPKVLWAQGRYYYHGHRDYGRALQTYYQALAQSPGDADLLTDIGFVERRLGNYEDAVGHLLQAAELSPLDATLIDEIGQTYWGTGEFTQARTYLEKALKLQPEIAGAWSTLAETAFLASGEAAKGLAVYDRVPMPFPDPAIYSGWAAMALEAGDPALALDRLGHFFAVSPDLDSDYLLGTRLLGEAYLELGMADSARQVWMEGLALAETFAEESHSQSPEIMWVALQEALLGRFDSAKAHADEAVVALPLSLDQWLGTVVLLIRGRVYLLAGEMDEAIKIAEILFSPNLPRRNRAWMRHSREFARLRADLRYPALAAKYGLQE